MTSTERSRRTPEAEFAYNSVLDEKLIGLIIALLHESFRIKMRMVQNKVWSGLHIARKDGENMERCRNGNIELLKMQTMC